MERCSAVVRLGGDVTMTVTKHGVSPAEVIVLRTIHGDDAVVDVDINDTDKTTNGQEADRLRNAYGARNFILAFPGARPQLPEKFADIGIDDEPVAPRKKKQKAETTVKGVTPVTADDLPPTE